MEVIFATSNERKVGEARLACEPAGIKIVQMSVEIEEIQSNVPADVSLDKARKAFEALNKPLVVTDSFWRIPSLNGFPGAYMHDVADWFTSEDFIALMKGKTNRDIFFSENITYIDAEQTKFFAKEFGGTVTEQPRGTGISIENVAEFEGYTLGERREQGGYSHEPEDYVWIDFVNWFIEQQ